MQELLQNKNNCYQNNINLENNPKNYNKCLKLIIIEKINKIKSSKNTIEYARENKIDKKMTNALDMIEKNILNYYTSLYGLKNNPKNNLVNENILLADVCENILLNTIKYEQFYCDYKD